MRHWFKIFSLILMFPFKVPFHSMMKSKTYKSHQIKPVNIIIGGKITKRALEDPCFLQMTMIDMSLSIGLSHLQTIYCTRVSIIFIPVYCIYYKDVFLLAWNLLTISPISLVFWESTESNVDRFLNSKFFLKPANL